MNCLEIWYSIDKNERIMYDPQIKKMIVLSIGCRNKVRKLLPEWKVVTKIEALCCMVIP